MLQISKAFKLAPRLADFGWRFGFPALIVVERVQCPGLFVFFFRGQGGKKEWGGGGVGAWGGGGGGGAAPKFGLTTDHDKPGEADKLAVCCWLLRESLCRSIP